jgi:hypothetical protein
VARNRPLALLIAIADRRRLIALRRALVSQKAPVDDRSRGHVEARVRSGK